MTEEDIKKIEYLNLYQDSRIECERINCVMAAVKELKRSAKSSMNESVSKSSRSDLSDYIAKIEYKESELIKELNNSKKILEDIEKKIKKIKDKEEQLILTQRFILNKTIKEIAREHTYSVRNTYRIYHKAIKNFEIE